MADLSKIVDDLSSLTVLEAAELSKLLEEKWGVSAAAPVAMAMPAGGGGAAAPAEAAEEQTEFTVVLLDGGDKKINVIKEVRGVRSDLGLKEAKDLVEGAPQNVVENVSKQAADEVAKKLTEAGAKVQVKAWATGRGTAKRWRGPGRECDIAALRIPPSLRYATCHLPIAARQGGDGKAGGNPGLSVCHRRRAVRMSPMRSRVPSIRSRRG